MKNGCLSKLTITKSGYRATQYKKFIDSLPGFCTDKNCKHRWYYSYKHQADRSYFLTGISGYNTMVIHLSCQYRTRWSDCRDRRTIGARPTCTEMVEKSFVFYPNLQEQLLSDHNQQSKLKLQEQAKLITNKKSLMTIIFGQCDDPTRTVIALAAF